MPSNTFPFRRIRLRSAVLFCLTGSALASALQGQISSRPQAAPFLLDRQVQRADYNFRLGPLMLDLIGTFGIEYDDNVNTSEDNAIDDVILQPGLSLGTKWQLSEFNEINLSVGMEYWKYVDNSELDDSSRSFTVSPDTELSFRVLLGEVVIRVYDRLQYDISSRDSIGYVVNADGTVSVSEQDPGLFPRFSNILGAQSEWYISDTRFGAQIRRKDIWSTESEYEYIDRTDYNFLLGVDRQLAANFALGVGFEYEDINYDQGVNNDGEIYRIGPYIDWGVTEVVTVRAGLAYENADFDSDSAITATDDSTYSGLSGSVRIAHVVNEAVNHGLEAYRRTAANYTSNFEVTDGLRHTAAFQIFPRLRLDTLLSHEDVESSGGFLNDDYTRFEGGLSFNLVLGPQLTADVGYRYEDKNSDAALRNYERNRLRILFQYDF